jgi:hypothetical protein
MQNRDKQVAARSRIATNYMRHAMGAPNGAPMFVRSTGSAQVARVIGIVQSVDTNAPTRKLVKSGARMVRRVSFK